MAFEAADRVGQTSRLSHDGRRAVGQRVHLIEAARFEAGRHDERIRAGLDPVRRRLVVPDEGAETAGSVGLEEAHRAFERRLAGAQHCDADAATDELGCGLEKEIEAFLVCEAADRAEDHAGVAGLEAREATELRAALRLPAEVLRSVVRGEVVVVRRVPDGRVDSVQNAHDPLAARP